LFKPNGQPQMFSTVVPVLSYDITLTEEGLYSWQVAGFITNCLLGPWSDLVTFEVPPEISDIVYLTTPINGATACVGTSTSIDFESSALVGDYNYEFEWANNDLFENSVSSIALNSQVSRVFSEVGTIYWRVRALDSFGCHGPWSNSYILELAPLTLSVPPHLQSDRFVCIGSECEYTWDLVQGASSYGIEFMCPRERMTEIIVVGQSLIYTLPYQDVWSWRVRAHNPCAIGEWTGAVGITTEVQPPELLSPADGADVLRGLPQGYSWQTPANVDMFLVEWATSSSFASESIINHVLTSSGSVTVLLNSLEHTLYWRVTPIRDGCYGDPSDSRRVFCIQPPVPGIVLLDTPLHGGNVYANDPSTEFCVISNPLAAEYDFQWSRGISEMSQAQIEATETCVTHPLSTTGKWSWRARAINSAGTGPWSETRKFSVIFSPVPLLRMPEPDDAKLSNTSVSELCWSPVPDADHYTVQVAGESDFSKNITQWNSETTCSNLEVKKEQMRFWRVRPEFSRSSGEWSTIKSIEEGLSARTSDQREELTGDLPADPEQADRPDRGDSQSLDSPEDISVATPTEYALYQNYPNPFNPSTQIRYDLPEDVRVQINVYNTLGQLVVQLRDEAQEAGRYTIFWDGKDVAGLEAATGMYIYQIRAGSFVDAKKMLLLK
jgi:hypothetical protein